MDSLNQNYLCRVITYDGGIAFCVLCLKCRNQTRGFKRTQATELPCAECGAVYQPAFTDALEGTGKVEA